MDEFELALKSLRGKEALQEEDSFQKALQKIKLEELSPEMRDFAEKTQELRSIPQRINVEQPLPTGGEPMVGGPDILAMEQGQTKTFMEGPEGKPVEVRRAEAIGITGKPIPQPISPDGLSYEARANLIKQKQDESSKTQVSGLTMELQGGETPLMKEINDLRRNQLEHDSRYKNWLSQMVGGGEGVTPSGEKVQTLTRRQAATKAVMDFNKQIDDIIANDNFLEYAAKQGLTSQGFWQRKLGRIGIGSESYNEEITRLQKDPEARKLAEEWAMTTPDFTENVSDIFGRAWDGYASAVGAGPVGAVGLTLKAAGLENVGQTLVDAAQFADDMRARGQDLREVGAFSQFGRDVSGGIGYTAGAIAFGGTVNAARASLGYNTPKVIDLLQKGSVLTFSGLNSAWGGYSEARANNATDEQAKQAALFSALTQAPLELVSPLQKWIGRFDPKQQERIYKGLNKAATAVIEGTEEALFNEMPQQVAGNLVKKYVYDPNQDIFEGVEYAGGVGGAAGVLTSIFTQMLGVKKVQQTRDPIEKRKSEVEFESDKESEEFVPDAESALAAQMMQKSTEIDNLKEEIANDEMGLQAIEKGTPERQQAEMAINDKKQNLVRLEEDFNKLSVAPKPAPKREETQTKEQVTTRIEELNKEFDALDENDTAGQDRVNRELFAEQNKLAAITAVEQGIEPQATTPTRAAAKPPSGREYPYGTFYPERPVLNAFVKQADKALKGIKAVGKRAQKLKNAIRTGITKNAGFVAGIGAKVVSAEEFARISGREPVTADSGTYMAAYSGGNLYLVLPNVNQLKDAAIKGEKRAASMDAALDQEARAAEKKLEEEMIHLAMYKALQEEYANLKKPKLTEQEFMVQRLTQIARELKRTNPDVVPNVSQVYLGKIKDLDDVTLSMEFMRMVIQRVRTGKITEDLMAIRAAEREAFTDNAKNAISAFKNAILNALQMLRNSLVRYLGKGTSTREVKKMEDTINAILDEYGIVGGEANYEFKDYSAAQPTKAAAPRAVVTTTPEEEVTEPAAEPVSSTITARAGTTPREFVEGEEVQLEGGNMERLMRLLSVTQYAKNPSGTIGKESFQNSVDAVMKLPEGTDKIILYGSKNIDGKNTFNIADNGVGMTPELMVNVFLRAAVSGKAVGEGGGYGLAKLAFLGGPKEFKIVSVSENNKGQKIKSTLSGTGESFFRFNDKPPKVKLQPDTLINLTPDFKDALTLEYTQVPDDTKTGTASQYVVDKDSWQADSAVRQGAEYVQGLSTMGVQDNPEQKYEGELNGLAEITKSLGFFPFWSSVRLATSSPEYTAIHSFSTPYADVDVIAKTGSKIAKQRYLSVPVLNRSIYQFRLDVNLQEEVALPEVVAVNIKPKVTADDVDYPFTPNRESIKDNIKEKVSEYFTTTGARELKKLNDKYKNALNSAVKIKDGGGAVILDAGSTVPDSFMDMLANNTSVKKAYEDVKKIQNAILKILAKRTGRAFDGGKSLYGRAKFAGLLIGAKAYGVHFGPRGGSQDPTDPEFRSFIYHDIWKEMDLAYREFNETSDGPLKDLYEAMSVEEQMSEIYDIFLRKVAGVAFHEAVHQQTSSEAEDLARELTFKAGDIIQSVVDLLDSDLNTYERIQTINDLIRQKEELDKTSNEDEAGEFILSQGGYDGYALAERGTEGEGRAATRTDRTEGRGQAPEPPIVARAAYVQYFEVFNRYGENRREEQIQVEAENVEEARTLIRQTPQYLSYQRRSREKKIKFFSMGEPMRKRLPGESPIVAAAGQTQMVSEQRRITNEMLGEIESAIESIKPKRSRAGKEYVSRTTQKGKTYPSSLVSPYSPVVNLYTSDTATESLNAIKKIMQKNPNLDFLTMVSNIANQTENYGLNITEQSNITAILSKLMPIFHQEVMESDSLKDRENIALNGLDIQYNLSKAVVNFSQAASRILNGAKMIRNIGNAGTAVAAYKSKIIDSLASLHTIIKGDFESLANAVRGDRRKAVDNVFALKEVLAKISKLKTQAEKNPQAAADAIRKMVAGKKTRKAREIVLEFCASMFDLNGDKYANMMVDETAKAIMSIGADRKEFASDNVYKYIYGAFASVAKQTAKEQAEKGAEPKAKEPKRREGKFIAQVKAVIGNDKAYKEFIKQLKAKIGENYQDKAQFESDYKELFDMLGDRQWSDAMRNQAIKDSADFLDYKFKDLITYIGENRSAAQSAVKAHIKLELSDIGATDEQIEKFVDDVQSYLNKETAKRVKKSLGFDISKETGKIIGGTIEKAAMKKVATAEERFQLAKTLKGLTKLAATDQRAFLDKLNELIITELGFDEATSQELSKYIEEQMAKAIQAQKSENLQSALDRAQETLSKNNIKPKTNQRTILQRLIEMANMGQLDEFGVYEAFRQTHNFGTGYMEWNPNLANQLREWGDRIAALPEGVTRSIEEQKLGMFMLENQVFSARDYFSSYWYFALLSQVGTQAVNFMGSAFNLLGNIAVWSIYTNGKATAPMLRALYRATLAKEAPSRNAFGYVMQTGLNPSALDEEELRKYPKLNVFEGANPNNTPKWAYNLITFGDGKIDYAPKWLNATLATVSPKGLMRVMRATDAFMRQAAYEARAASFGAAPFQQNAYNKAKEQAIRELSSLKSKGRQKEREIIIRANEIFAQQRLDQNKRINAEQDAMETIYTQKPVGIIGLIASMVNKLLQKSPITQLFIPFTNVVANVLNENLNYLPVVGAVRLAGNVRLSSLLRGKIELLPSAGESEFIKGRQEKAAEIAIKASLGFGAMIVPIIISALTGGDDEDQSERPPVQFYATGPADPEQNKIWKENGGIPYSMRIGDKYVSYLYTPLVIPLATGSMLADSIIRYKKKQEKTPVDYAELAITAVVAPFAIGFVAALDQSFLTGVADLIELKEARDIPAAGKNIATNIMSRLAVPGILRDFQKTLTDEKLEGDIYITNLLREFPGSEEFLDKKLGYFGEPARYNSIIQENGLGRRAFSLIGRVISSETPDPAFEIMYRNGIIPPKWQGSLQWSNEVRMSRAEQREFVSIAGPLMNQWIIDNEEIIDSLTTEEAQEFISNNFSQIRRSVKSDLEYEKRIGID